MEEFMHDIGSYCDPYVSQTGNVNTLHLFGALKSTRPTGASKQEWESETRDAVREYRDIQVVDNFCLKVYSGNLGNFKHYCGKFPAPAYGLLLKSCRRYFDSFF
jgi:hypothetical protein